MTADETFQSPEETTAAPQWHAGLPPQVKLEVIGAKEAGTDRPSVYDADFIMAQGKRCPNRCQWLVEFRSQNGLHRASLEAAPNADGTLSLQAQIEGRESGPAWSNPSVPDLSQPVTLTFDAERGETPSAGVDWPQEVPLTPLSDPAPKQVHYISPEPLASEVAMMGAGSSSSGSGCIVFVVQPSNVPICVGADQQFTPTGVGLSGVNWTTSPAGTPATGTGATFTTKWTTVGLDRKVTASCSGTSAEAEVDVVGVDKIIVEGSNPEDEGPVTINLGTSLVLRAKREPAPINGPWPANRPTWEISDKPDNPFIDPRIEPDPSDRGKATFYPDLSTVDPTPATFKVKATCGTSNDEFTIIVNRCVVTGVSP